MYRFLKKISPEIKNKIKNSVVLHFPYVFARTMIRNKIAMSYYDAPLKYIKKWQWLDTENSNFYYQISELNRFYLANILSVVTQVNPEIIISYFEELENNTDLKTYLKNALIKTNYNKDISIHYARRIGWYALVRILKPKILVETGVSHGVGACVLASALEHNKIEGFIGYYYGLDIDPEAGALFKGRFENVGEIIYGDSISTLINFKNEIDVFINDSDHSFDYEYNEYLTIAEKLSDRALIIGDNSHTSDRLAKFSMRLNRKFIFFKEEPKDHWYPGAGIGLSFKD